MIGRSWGLVNLLNLGSLDEFKKLFLNSQSERMLDVLEKLFAVVDLLLLIFKIQKIKIQV